MTIFFTADPHFVDHRTINIQRRPFATVAEMDATLIANWNAVVGRDDEVWHLDNVARRPGDVQGLLKRLNGHKYLIRGNNDPERPTPATNLADMCIYPYHLAVYGLSR